MVLDNLSKGFRDAVVDAEFVEGDTGDAIIARMEHQLGQGRLAEAIKQSESLSEPARKALGPWLGKARARVDGAAAMRQLETKILTALGGVQTQ